MNQRSGQATFSTGLGAVLALAGVAIGLGNVWRFPYTMGENGGGAFLFVYIAIVIGFGLPLLMAELALGRHTRSGPIGALTAAGLPHASVWGWLIVIIIIMAVALYNTIVGQVLYCIVKYAPAALQPESVTLDWSDAAFGGRFAYILIAMSISCIALAFGVRVGIERVSKTLMPLFALLFAIILVRALTLDGAGAGVRQLLVPDWGKLNGQTVFAAMGQAMFSLGLSGSIMVVYGSYMRSSANIPRTAMLTAGADLGAALLAGFIIVPAAVAFSVPLKSGPPLMFNVMPQVFGQMPAGDFFALTFFVAILLVAVLSVMGAFEVIVDALGQALGMGRRPALLLIFVSQTVLVVPLMRSQDYFDWSDLIWITTMMPLGSMVAAIALAWCIKRGRTLDELRRGGTRLVPDLLFFWIKYIIPVCISFVLVYGLWTNDLIKPLRESLFSAP